MSAGGAMLRLRPGNPVRRSALVLNAAPISAGAQGLEGSIVRSQNTPFLCKLFSSPKDAVDSAALQWLIDFRESQPVGRDRDVLRNSFSWPLHRVVDDATSQTIGILIPAAEPRFSFAYEGAMHLREGQHLPRPDTIAGRIDDRRRLRILADLGEAWDVLSRHRLVYGDANSRNLAVALDGGPSVFIMDCDGIRAAADPRLGLRVQANWTDPYTSRANTLESDNYLYALWVMRTLAREMVAAPASPLDRRRLPAGLSKHRALAELLSRSLGAPGGRPTPGAFVPVLRAMESRL